MDHDPETSSWLHDLWGNAGELAREESPEPVGKFFQEMDLHHSAATVRTSEKAEPESLELYGQPRVKPDWEEMRNFLEASKRQVERGSMTKRELRASLAGVLRKFATALGA